MMSAAVLLALVGTFVDPDVPTTLVFPPYGHCMGIYRAGTEQLAMLLGGLVRFDNPQGLSCVKLEEWDEPGRSDDDELAVYGVNSGSGHVIYNATMYTLGLYGGEGAAPDQLSRPHGISSSPDGTVLVADTGNRRVVILGRRGSRMRPSGTLEATFDAPWDVTRNGDGSVCVTDRDADLLYLFDDLDDASPDTVGLPSPTGLASVSGGSWIAEEASHPHQVVVVEDGQRLVNVQEGDVTASVTVGECGGLGFDYVAIDYRGNVWASDSASCQIHKLTSDLRYLDSFGSPGTGDRQFDHPTGITIWRRFGQVFVAEREGARYFWIGSDIRDYSIRQSPRRAVITGVLTETSHVMLEIISDGERIAMPVNSREPAGELLLEWNGEDSSGRPVPKGTYTMKLLIEPTYSSRGYFEKTWTDEVTLGEAPPVETQEGGGRRS